MQTNKKCFSSTRNRCHSVAFRVTRRMDMQTDRCITGRVTLSIPTVNGSLDRSLHALSPSFRLHESTLLSCRHLPTKPSLFPCDFGRRFQGEHRHKTPALKGKLFAFHIIIQYCSASIWGNSWKYSSLLLISHNYCPEDQLLATLCP